MEWSHESCYIHIAGHCIAIRKNERGLKKDLESCT